jgi:Transposase IS4
MPQLDQPSQVVGDSTNPAGTLRPNLPPEPKTGDKYDPMPAPEFDFKINLPVDSMDALAIFDLFYSPEQLAIIVASTNKQGLAQSQIGPRRKRALNWIDITIGELYAFLGIHIYIALHIENQTKDY